MTATLAPTAAPTPADVRAAAWDWHAAGVVVLPVRVDGSKAPGVVAWRAIYKGDADRPGQVELDTWFGGEPSGLGILTGAVSGNLEMLELEGRAVAEGAEQRLIPALTGAGVLDVWRRLVAGYAEWTPSGGLHLMYRLDGAPVPGNAKLASRPARPDELDDRERALAGIDPGRLFPRVLAETRGEGGFVVVAPSHGPVHATGRPWLYAGDSHPGEVPTITAEERAALFSAIAAALDDMPTAVAPPAPNANGKAPGVGIGDRPGDLWAAQTTWAQILEPHGWVYVYSRGDMTYWRRPGKKLGVSARTGGQLDQLYVWSTSTDFPSERSITKIKAYATLEHRGDVSAAARALRGAGHHAAPVRESYDWAFGDGTAMPAGDRPSLRAAGPSDARPAPAGGTGGGAANSRGSEAQTPERETAPPAGSLPDWAPPRKTNTTGPLPAFPAELLPPVLRDIARGAAAEIQAPLDVAGMLALSVAASTLAGKVQVVGRRGHYEHLMLWTLTVASSAERKTPVFNLLRRPLVDVEIEHNEAARFAAQRDEIELEVIEDSIKRAKKEANPRDLTALHAEVEPLLQRRDELLAPSPAPCAWVSSPTPEALHVKMSENAGRVAVFADEGGIVGIIAGRYSSKGGADLDPFLHGFVGSPLRAPRAGKDRKDVPAAYLTMGLAVQPDVLDEVGDVAGAESRGLLGRFLFALPTSAVGTRLYGDSVPVPEEVEDAYAKLASAWARWAPSKPGEADQISLDPTAYATYGAWHDTIEHRLAEGGDLAQVPSWGGKIAGTTLRIAGIMHCYSTIGALGLPISEGTIRAAIDLTERYLIPHALASFDAMRESVESRITRRIMAWLAARPDMARFKLRDIYQALKGARGTVTHTSDLEPALATLEIEGYIRRAEAKRADSIEYDINPLWNRAEAATGGTAGASR